MSNEHVNVQVVGIRQLHVFLATVVNGLILFYDRLQSTTFNPVQFGPVVRSGSFVDCYIA